VATNPPPDGQSSFVILFLEILVCDSYSLLF